MKRFYQFRIWSFTTRALRAIDVMSLCCLSPSKRILMQSALRFVVDIKPQTIATYGKPGKCGSECTNMTDQRKDSWYETVYRRVEVASQPSCGSNRKELLPGLIRCVFDVLEHTLCLLTPTFPNRHQGTTA